MRMLYMMCRRCKCSTQDSPDIKLLFRGASGFICGPCNDIESVNSLLERLSSSPVEKSLVARGYKPGLDLEIIPYHKSDDYEDVVSFEDNTATVFYLVDNDGTVPFNDLESAFSAYLDKLKLLENAILI